LQIIPAIQILRVNTTTAGIICKSTPKSTERKSSYRHLYHKKTNLQNNTTNPAVR